MNCQGVVGILNDRRAGRLSAAELEHARAHLAACADCAGDWTVQERVDTAPIPEMPSSLLLWRPDGSPAAAAVVSVSRRRSRNWIVPVLLLAGAAAATLAVNGTKDRADEIRVPVDEAGGSAVIEAAEPLEAVNGENDADAAGAETPAAVSDLPRHRLLVLPPAHQGEYTAVAVQAGESVHRAMLRFFGDRPEIEVIEVSAAELADAQVAVHGSVPAPVPPTEISKMSPEVTRWLGSEYSIRVLSRALRPGMWLINIDYRGTTVSGGTGSGGVISDGRATEIARTIYARLFPDTGVPYLESVVTDSGFSDSERIAALEFLLEEYLRWGRLGARLSVADPTATRPELSESTIRAAIELGRSGVAAKTRQTVWELLGQMGHPMAVQALMDALVSDADPGIRAAAADELQDYQTDPIVQASLRAASLSDPSADVRLRAHWSSLTYAERTEYVGASLVDSTLTAEQRIAPLIHARTPRRGVGTSASLDAEIPPVTGDGLEALAAIATSSRDPAVRRAALLELGLGAYSGFLAVLQSEPEAKVREDVAIELANRRAQDPNVIADIERQLEQTEVNEATRALFERGLSPSSRPPEWVLNSVQNETVPRR